MRVRPRITGAAAAVVAGLTAALLLPGVATAAPPSHDDFDSATALTLPFAEDIDLEQATAAPDDPDACLSSEARTVWYSFTATEDTTLRFDTGGESVTTAVFTGSRGALALVPRTCATDWHPRALTASAGTTYHLVVAGSEWTSSVRFTAEVLPRPANDDFAGAQPIDALPFSARLPLAAATSEPGEPKSSCDVNPGSPSVWYTFTPAETGAFVLDADSWGGNYTPRAAAYTGTSLADLTEVACSDYRDVVRFEAGRTLFIQFTAAGTGARDLTFGLRPAAALVPILEVSPEAPSVFDDVRFDNHSHDPEGWGTGIDELDFGDGTVIEPEQGYAYHRYAADGDYTVRMTVSGVGGRTATTTQVVSVRTHDVAVTGFTAPAAARVGVTRGLTVDVANTRYAENVTVTLYRNGEAVGTLDRAVPAQPNRTVRFSFDYTFTDADLAEGTVVFKAVAEPAGVRDALPTDNTVIAPSTRVRPATT